MIFLTLPTDSEDSLLMARARQGDQRAVMEIYERYFQPIYQFVRMRTGDAALSEDIASSVFLNFVRAIRRGSAPRDHLRGWLFQVARNELARQTGKQHSLSTQTLEEWMPAPPDDNPEAAAIQRFTMENARAHLRTLSPDQQEVLVLRFGQALSVDETADVMGRTIDAVKSLQARALRSLRAALVPAEVTG